MWGLNWFRENQIITIINDGTVYVEAIYQTQYLGPAIQLVEYLKDQKTFAEYISPKQIVVTYLGEPKGIVQYIKDTQLNIELQ